MTKPTLLIIGDFVKHTGFARVNEALAEQLSDRWDIAVVGVNFKGDPTPLAQRYRLYPAYLGGDLHGLGRIADIVRLEQPAACLFVCDPWIGADYARKLAELEDAPPCLLYAPVDAIKLRRVDIEPLNLFDMVIAYTQFGARELARSGLAGPIAVIPHGIDLDLFRPIEQAEARAAVGLPPDTYAVLILDQNNPRKRLDIAFDAFRLFAADKPEHVKLVYHGPLGGQGKWDILGMAEDLGIDDRLVLPRRDGLAIPHDQLPYLYSMCDVKLSCCAGEGWGLTTMEAMACGLPNIVPDFAALGEWARDAVKFIPAETPFRHVEINTVGMAPRAQDAEQALEVLYWDHEQRQELRAAGLALVARPEYHWSQIANQFDALLKRAIAERQAHPQVAALNVRPNTIDAWVVEQVATKNEYGLGELAPDDLVIDIGAHIGAFSRLAFDRGSRQIEAYEADSANVTIARANLEPLGIAVTHAAVWRSDVAYPCDVPFTGHDGRNTGAGNVVFGNGARVATPAIALDSIIGDRHVAVLKIDAESAEWPILLSSRKLRQISLIVGEYHEIGGAHDQNAMPESLVDLGCERFTATDLRTYLESQGFIVEMRPYVLSSTGATSNMGSFRAVKRAPEQMAVRLAEIQSGDTASLMKELPRTLDRAEATL